MDAIDIIIRATDLASQTIDSVGKSIDKLGNTTQKIGEKISDVGSNIQGYGKSILGFIAPVTAVLGAGLAMVTRMAWNQVSSVEQATSALGAYEKNATKVQNVLSGLLAYARSDMGVLFNRADLFAAAQGLKVMGDNTDQLIEHVKIMSRSVGLGLSNWNDLTTIIGRVGSTGRLTGIDFDNLTKAGFVLNDSLRNTNITFDQLFKALDKGIPADAMADQVNSIVGIGVRLQTAFRGIGNAILGVDLDTNRFIAGGAGDQLIQFLKTLPALLKAPEVQQGFAKLGQSISGMITSILPKIITVISWLGKQSPIILKIILGLLALGTTLVYVGKLVEFFGGAVQLVGMIISGFSIWLIPLIALLIGLSVVVQQVIKKNGGLTATFKKLMVVMAPLVKVFHDIADAAILLFTGDFKKGMFGGVMEDNKIVTRILDIRNAFGDFVSALISFNPTRIAGQFEKIFTGLKNINWDNISNDVTGGLDSIEKKVSNFFKGIDWGEIAHILSLGLDAAFNTAGGLLKIGLNFFGNLAGDLVRAMNQVDWTKVSDAMIDGLHTLENKVGTFFKDLFKNVDWGTIGKTLDDLIDGVFATVGGLANTGINLFGDLSSQLIKALKKIDWKKAIDTALTSLDEIKDRLFEKLTKLLTGIDWTKLSVSASKGLGAIVKSIGKFLENIDWDQLTKFIFDAFGDLVKLIVKVIGSIDWKKVAEAFGRFQLEAMKLILVQLPIAIAKFSMSMQKKLMEELISAFQNIDWKALPGQIGQAFVNMWVNIFTNVLPRLKDKVINAVVDAWNALLNVDWTEVIKNVAGILVNIAQFATIELPQKILSLLWEAIKGAFRLMTSIDVSDIVGWLTGVFLKIWMFVNVTIPATLGGLLLQAFNAAFRFVVSNIAEGASIIWNWFKGLPGRILGMIGDAGHWLFDIGRQIIQGLVDGIENMFSSLIGKMTSIASRVKNVFKNILGISSPSKVFIGYGNNIVQGLVNGLNNATGVDRAVSNLSDQLTSIDTPQGANFSTTSTVTSQQASDPGGFHMYGNIVLNDASAVDRFFERMDRMGELSAMGVPV